MDYKTFILGWVALTLIIAIAHLWKSTLDDLERTKYESEVDLKWITNKIKEQRIPNWSMPMAIKEIENMNTINEVKDEIVKMVMKYHDLKEDELFQRTDDVPFSPVQDCAFKYKILSIMIIHLLVLLILLSFFQVLCHPFLQV